MDESGRSLEELIRTRPAPSITRGFREKTLAAMRAATRQPSWTWLEWGMAAAALFILWGGLLMMEGQRTYKPSLHRSSDRATFDAKLRETVPELLEHDRRRMWLLSQLRP